MKHDGLIQSDEAEKLYSYPTLSGDSDTFLNGAGDFDHPHVEYYAGEAQGVHYNDGNWILYIGGSVAIPSFLIDPRGHIKDIRAFRIYSRCSNATPTADGLMSAADKALLDSIASYLADQQES